MEELIRVTPDKEKAQSILKMVETTLEMIKEIDKSKFPSNVAKEYYEAMRELISMILLMDGYKAVGEGAHKKQIGYLEISYKEFTQYEIAFIDELRVTRNKIAYDGFFVKESYIDRKVKDISKITSKLQEIVNKKIK